MKHEPPTASIIEFTKALVQCRSCVDTDTCEAVVAIMHNWLQAEGASSELLYSGADNQCVGVAAEFDSGLPGRVLCLNACLDTAPVGDLATWSMLPFAGDTRNGRLYGRGAADSKVGAAIFAHIFIRCANGPNRLTKGKLQVVFDGDEHSGSFKGVKSYLDRFAKPDVVAIGYPGDGVINCGARGFLRLVATVHGIASHSGSRRDTQQNAIVNAAKLIEELHSRPLPRGLPPFEFGPKLSVTSISGGNGFSVVPDRCAFNIDFRLTPTFGRDAALDHVEQAVEVIRLSCAESRPILSVVGELPAYSIDERQPFVKCLTEAAHDVLGRPVSTGVCGPSNIGNYLSTVGIPAVCGFGVKYEACHAADEFLVVKSIAPTFEVYRRAVECYLLEENRRSFSR